MSGSRNVLEDNADVINSLDCEDSIGYLYYNSNYGRGESELVQFPYVEPGGVGETKEILQKLDKYYSDLR